MATNHNQEQRLERLRRLRHLQRAAEPTEEQRLAHGKMLLEREVMLAEQERAAADAAFAERQKSGRGA